MRLASGEPPTPAPPAQLTIPPELARPLARIFVLGLAELARRDGSPPLVPGLAAFLAALDRSASGTVPGMLDAHGNWVGASEAAAVIGCSPRYVRRLAGSGRLIARRSGRDWLIDPQSAQDYRNDRIRRRRAQRALG
jgi:excisionase family DNA binding protein